jgi:hypothetical protein
MKQNNGYQVIRTPKNPLLGCSTSVVPANKEKGEAEATVTKEKGEAEATRPKKEKGEAEATLPREKS